MPQPYLTCTTHISGLAELTPCAPGPPNLASPRAAGDLNTLAVAVAVRYACAAFLPPSSFAGALLITTRAPSFPPSLISMLH